MKLDEHEEKQMKEFSFCEAVEVGNLSELFRSWAFFRVGISRQKLFTDKRFIKAKSFFDKFVS